MNNQIENAKKLLWHYFKVVADKSGVVLDNDCRVEIEGIVDDIADGVLDEIYIRKESQK